MTFRLDRFLTGGVGIWTIPTPMSLVLALRASTGEVVFAADRQVVSQMPNAASPADVWISNHDADKLFELGHGLVVGVVGRPEFIMRRLREAAADEKYLDQPISDRIDHVSGVLRDSYDEWFPGQKPKDRPSVALTVCHRENGALSVKRLHSIDGFSVSEVDDQAHIFSGIPMMSELLYSFLGPENSTVDQLVQLATLSLALTHQSQPGFVGSKWDIWVVSPTGPTINKTQDEIDVIRKAVLLAASALRRAFYQAAP
jgi:hypothetical protein